jgi:fructoselysine-6-P-deglycase FrlB-like protein
MARLNDTMLLKLPAVYSELAQEETTVERQAELMEGLNDVCRTQRQTNDSIWWVGLGTSIIACLAVTLKPRGD